MKTGEGEVWSQRGGTPPSRAKKERYLFNVPRRASLSCTPSPFAEMTVSAIQAAATCQLRVSGSRPSTNSRVPLQNRRDHLHASGRFTTPLG